MEKIEPYFVPFGRLLLAVIFIMAGASKIASGGAGMIEYMESAGVPGILFWPAALFELVAGLMVLVGYQTKLVAFLLAGFCLLTGALFHYVPADQTQMTMMFKNFGMAGGFLFLARFGAGEMSLDNRASSED